MCGNLVTYGQEDISRASDIDVQTEWMYFHGDCPFHHLNFDVIYCHCTISKRVLQTAAKARLAVGNEKRQPKADTNEFGHEDHVSPCECL